MTFFDFGGDTFFKMPSVSRTLVTPQLRRHERLLPLVDGAGIERKGYTKKLCDKDSLASNPNFYTFDHF